MATQEIGLNDALAAAGIEVTETDLAELIVQLGHDTPSHILVPAIHRNREQIRDTLALPSRMRRATSPPSRLPSPRMPASTCAASSSARRSPSLARTSQSRRQARWPS